MVKSGHQHQKVKDIVISSRIARSYEKIIHLADA